MTDGRPASDSPCDPQTLFHLAARWRMERGGVGDTYVPGAYAAESFIHCSYREQLDGVYERYYAGRDHDLVLLEIDRVTLEALVGASAVVDEASTNGELFPHVYAPLPHGAVRAVRELDWFN